MKRVKLLLLFAMFIAPIAASYFAYYVWQPEGRKNYGELVKQVSMTTQGVDLSGTPKNIASLQRQWVMVYVGGGACDKACAQSLYLMRQIRKIQGKEMDRIERLWVLSDAATPSVQIQREHAGLHYLRPTNAAMLLQFPDSARGGSLYMIDPLGHLMMRWPQNPDPKGIIRDIKQLLKASQIG